MNKIRYRSLLVVIHLFGNETIDTDQHDPRANATAWSQFYVNAGQKNIIYLITERGKREGEAIAGQGNVKRDGSKHASPLIIKILTLCNIKEEILRANRLRK